jgi:hypothetical protein
VIASQFIINRLATLLGTDATTLAPAASPPKLHLAQAPFTPTPALLIAGLTEATFQGYAALVCAINAQQVFQDPVSGLQCIQMIEPLGGWHFLSSGVTGLPQTIYGYYLTDSAGVTLYASALFPTPIAVTAFPQAIDVNQARFLLSQSALS